MILYVMRHAEAVEASDSLQDEWRYLTEKGRASVEKTSSKIARYGPKTRLTITSPLTRSVQTAEIAAAKAYRKNTVVASELLLPGADINIGSVLVNDNMLAYKARLFELEMVYLYQSYNYLALGDIYGGDAQVRAYRDHEGLLRDKILIDKYLS